MQVVYDDEFLEDPVSLLLPSPDDEILPGVQWGCFYDFFTPAFWASRMWLHRNENSSIYKIGSTLTEEVAACLLGGHGMKSEIAVAAFQRIRELGFLHGSVPKEKQILAALKSPLEVEGRSVRYRFPKQKSRFLHYAISQLHTLTPPENPQDFRNFLMTIPGIGPKTASWITRNWLGSSEVAIIDVHIHRAGILCGLFHPNSNVALQYFDLEKRFLAFANALEANAAVLDSIVWRYMKDLNRMAVRMLQQAPAL